MALWRYYSWFCAQGFLLMVLIGTYAVLWGLNIDHVHPSHVL